MTHENLSLFEPVEQELTLYSPLNEIYGEYCQLKAEIERVHDFIGTTSAMSYFYQGASVTHEVYSLRTEYLFDKAAAIKALDAEFWQKCMRMTDVLEAMPAEDRNAWHESIRKHQTPPFELNDVKATLRDQLLRRETYFANRVDGIFRALSGEHVTNQPQGFGTRLIMANIKDGLGGINYNKAEYLHDFRVVIGRLLQRTVPDSVSTRRLIDKLIDQQRYGEWHLFDGGAFKIRIYKKGTAHLETHPEVAWQLNKILAKLYPAAIPPSFRQKPVKIKEHVLRTDMIPFEILNDLGRADIRNEGSSVYFRDGLQPDTQEILRYLGGERIKPHLDAFWQFAYPVHRVIEEMLRTGVMPEKVSHQFYSTPDPLGDYAVSLLDIRPDNSLCEPSAGTGQLAKKLPKERTTCIEISHLHCTILEEMGFERVYHADFLHFTRRTFDRIIMNPPFAHGRALAHLRHAVTLLNPDGVLVAILPASMKDQHYFDGWHHAYSDVQRKAFLESGTGISVVVLKLTRAA